VSGGLEDTNPHVFQRNLVTSEPVLLESALAMSGAKTVAPVFCTRSR
jgi:hypothetical protein